MGWAEAAGERGEKREVVCGGVPARSRQRSEGGWALRLDSAWCPGPSRF